MDPVSKRVALWGGCRTGGYRFGPILVPVLAVMLLAGLANQARAQQSGGKTSEPGQIQRRIELEKLRPPAPEEQAPPVAVPVVPAPPAEVRKFILAGVQIVGTTIYKPDRLAEFYEHLLGREISAVEIDTILKAITERYRADGYVLSRAVAPPQGAEFGILRINVIEGFVEKVEFTGATPGREDLFRAIENKIKAETPLTLGTLERNLLLMATLPGVTATPALKSIDDERGAYLLTIRLGHRPVTGFVTLDNRGTTGVGKLQSYAGVNLNSVAGLLEQTRVSAFTVPNSPEELIYGEFRHEHVLNSEGTRLAVSAARSIVDTGPAGSSDKQNSLSTVFSLEMSHPLFLSRDRSLTLNGKFNVSDNDLHETGDPFEDRLRVLRLGASYIFKDDLAGTNWLSAELSKGFRILNASDPGSPSLSRAGAKTDFFKATIDATRQQTLGKIWSVAVSVVGQKSADTLVSSEEFSVGGQRFGRAYDPSEITGTDGAAGSVEIRLAPSYRLWPLKGYTLYGFYDFGAVWGPGITRDTLASTGLGMRFTLPYNLSGGLEVGLPLTRPLTPGEADDGHDPRIFFNLLGTF